MHVRVLCSLLRPPVRLSLPPMAESTVSGVYCLIIYSDHIPLLLVDHNRTTHSVAEIAAERLRSAVYVHVHVPVCVHVVFSLTLLTPLHCCVIAYMYMYMYSCMCAYPYYACTHTSLTGLLNLKGTLVQDKSCMGGHARVTGSVGIPCSAHSTQRSSMSNYGLCV